MENIKHLAQYLGMAESGEELMYDSLHMVANRHDRDVQISNVLKKLAEYSHDHIKSLRPFEQRYEKHFDESPERLRSALFHGTRLGSEGLLRDLKDLTTIANDNALIWNSIRQAAHSLHDKELIHICEHAEQQVEEQINWLKSNIKQLAPQALITSKDSLADFSGYKTPTPAAVPEKLWSPLAAAVIVIIVGGISVIAGNPWLLPSLGPSAYMQASNPAHPSAKLYNVIAGHVIGIMAGFLAVALLNAWSAPIVLIDHQLVPVRMWTAAIALAVTLFMCLLLNADHPPAASTTLLIALGSINSLEMALHLATGAALIGIAGEFFRRVRLKGSLIRSV